MANALLLALALLAQDPSSAPQATAQGPNAPPADEYGYVAWCYGALGGYASLYDRVMPEVTRIEKAFPGPDGVAASLKTYPELKAQAQKDLKTFASAITAAEKASPRPISEYGGAQVKRGSAIWQGADSVDKARLAQMWMSWSPPGDCERRAKALETKSTILGKALNYNSVSATTAAPAPQPAPPAPQPAEAAPLSSAPIPVSETPAPRPVATPKPAAPKAAPVKTTAPAKPLAKAPTKAPAKALPPIGGNEVIVDPVNPIPCAGSLVPAKRGGRDVLICKAD
jgi:cell division septation protein DedD